MTLFLTSSPFVPDGTALCGKNGLIPALRENLPARPLRAVFAASSPDEVKMTELFGGHVRAAFERAGFAFEHFLFLDRRTQRRAAELLADCDLLVLAGGHVPTQNRFFHETGLRALLAGFDGAVLGISAGSMNAADLVYAQPELPGEALDPGYQRFLPGLGLTDVMLCPHYNLVRDSLLDGQRLFEDITVPDSRGRRFLIIPDGTWVYSKNGEATLLGEAWAAEDGAMRKICEDGETLRLTGGKTDD